MSFLSDMTLDQMQINLLCDALEEWCTECDTPLDSQAGRDAATVMLGLYKTGHADKSSILSAMRNVTGA